MASTITDLMTDSFKYPVPRIAAQTAADWADELASHFGCQVGDLHDRAEAVMSYPTDTVRVELMDGSVAEFKYAFFLASDAKKAVAVFTEHCGHHVFPYHGAKVSVQGRLVYAQGAQ